MQNVLGIPEDKRAHRFISLDKDNYYYQGGRSDNYTVIEINMMEGQYKYEAYKSAHESINRLMSRIFRL